MVWTNYIDIFQKNSFCQIPPKQHDPVLKLSVEFDNLMVIHYAEPDGWPKPVHGESVGLLQVAGEHAEEADYLGVVIVSEHLDLLLGDEPLGPRVEFLPGKVGECQLGGGTGVVLDKLALLEELEGGELLDVVLVADLPPGVPAVDVREDDGLGRDLLPDLGGSLAKLRPGLR